MRETQARVGFEPHRAGTPATAVRRIAAAQGVYYVVSGIWPLASMRTFERVTGPKTDRWLVKTLGALIAVIGATLLVEARRPNDRSSSKLLGAGSAGALAAPSAGHERARARDRPHDRGARSSLQRRGVDRALTRLGDDVSRKIQRGGRRYGMERGRR